jgi:hypothetical protein
MFFVGMIYAAAARPFLSSESDIKVKSTGDIAYHIAVIHKALRLRYAIPSSLPRIVPEGGDVYAGNYVPRGVSTNNKSPALYG